jgi:hypothetical protein
LQSARARRNYRGVKGEEKIASPPGSSWTRPDVYIGAMARKRTFRRAREGKPRTQPVTPRAWLSTVPFAVVLAVLAVLVVAITIAAFPGSQPIPKTKQSAIREQGVAPRGWFQEAQKSFHH